MRNTRLRTLLYSSVGVIALTSTAFASKTTSEPFTFNRDVLPILQKNCQSCHRPGEAAPMSFMTWRETRPWAKAIREAVRLKKMPPWFADPHVGKFANDRSLRESEIETIVKWADSGAPEGSAKDAPAAAAFVDGWNIGRPDWVVEMPSPIQIPDKGTVEYTYVVIPSGFTEDKWVQLSEVRPGNRKALHHVIAFVREPGAKWLADAKPGIPFIPKSDSPDRNSFRDGQWLIGYAPGTVPDNHPDGEARLVKAGSDIILQLHYTATGKPETDQTRVGFRFAKEAPKQRVYTLAAGKGNFVIPPGADNHRLDAKFKVQHDMTLTALLPHMHLRGKAFEYRLVFPDGRTEEILKVPNYSFSWQLTYVPEKPIFLPKGTLVECSAWYDNSANNPNNPDPKAEVHEGDQSWDEMMIGFFNVAFDPAVSLQELRSGPKPSSSEKAPSGE